MKLTLITVDTRHFTFESVGMSREEAETVLRQTFRAHVQRTPSADPAYFEGILGDLDAHVHIREIEPGMGTVDGETVVRRENEVVSDEVFPTARAAIRVAERKADETGETWYVAPCGRGWKVRSNRQVVETSESGGWTDIYHTARPRP